MVTGDAKATAISIAKKCNILSGEPRPGEVMEGKDFRSYVGGLIYDVEDEQKLFPKVANMGNM